MASIVLKGRVGSRILLTPCGYPKDAMRTVLCLTGLLWLLHAWAEVKILPGDSLKITVEQDASLSRVYKVDDKGNLQMPLIGVLKAAGLTPDELAREIARRLREGDYIRNPQVKVELLERAKPSVSVAGAVRKAGEFTLQEGWRLADALREAEPSEAADLSAIRLERQDGTMLTLNFLKFQREGDQKENPELRPGDRIFVPLQPGGRNVIVVGAVQKPGVVPYEAGLTLIQAIGKAGGTLPEADTSRITLKRADTPTPQNIDLNTLQQDIPLQPGDQITVPYRAVRQFVLIRGGVRRPGLIAYAERMTLTQAIEAAGGPLPEAKLERITIERPAGKKTQRIVVNLLQVAQGTRPDEPLQPGDTIDVPLPRRRSGSLEEPLRVLWLLLSIYFLIARR
jgi:polysaccharide export outer membrane protein